MLLLEGVAASDTDGIESALTRLHLYNPTLPVFIARFVSLPLQRSSDRLLESGAYVQEGLRAR